MGIDSTLVEQAGALGFRAEDVYRVFRGFEGWLGLRVFWGFRFFWSGLGCLEFKL